MHCVTATTHCKMKQERGQNYLLVILRDIDGVDLLICGDHEKGSLTNLTKTKTYMYKQGRHTYVVDLAGTGVPGKALGLGSP